MSGGCPHNRAYECNDCTEARHAAEHPELVDGCLACKLGTIQVSQRVKPKRVSGPPSGNHNEWERGIPTDHRGVPFLDSTGTVIGVKKYAENRHALEAERRRLHNDPAPFGAAS